MSDEHPRPWHNPTIELQRDSSDLLVPIDEAIADFTKRRDDAIWIVNNPTIADAERSLMAAVLVSHEHHLADLIRRRDAGETHEVMF